MKSTIKYIPLLLASCMISSTRPITDSALYLDDYASHISPVSRQGDAELDRITSVEFIKKHSTAIIRTGDSSFSYRFITRKVDETRGIYDVDLVYSGGKDPLKISGLEIMTHSHKMKISSGGKVFLYHAEKSGVVEGKTIIFETGLGQDLSYLHR